MSKIKTLVISNYFEQNFGYQEVQIADTLYDMGYDVTVISSDMSQFDRNKKINDKKTKYKIIRLDKFIRLSSTLYPIGNFEKLIKDSNPDIVFLVHPMWGLPYFLLKFISTKCQIITIETLLWDNYSLSIRSRLATALIRKYWARKYFAKSNLIVANTNETVNIVNSLVKNTSSISEKLITIGLGYDSKIYFYSSDLRNRMRVKYNIDSNSTVLVTITRIVKYKKILERIDTVINAMRKNEKLIYIIAGFDNLSYSNLIKNKINNSGLNKRIIVLSFVDKIQMNELFNCADYGLWFTPTISIQQGMGTGLKSILPVRSTLDHLLTKENGTYYQNFEHLYKILLELKNFSDRKLVHNYNSKFSYQNILKTMIEKSSFHK